MGEAKRRRQTVQQRTWAKGSLRIEAGDKRGFEWSGTRQDAVDLQSRYLAILSGTPISAKSYADRAAGYLVAFGAPQVGDPDRRPSNFGGRWEADDVELQQLAANSNVVSPSAVGAPYVRRHASVRAFLPLLSGI